MRISRDLLEAIRSHAASLPDREVCGLLLGTPDHVIAVRPTENTASDPTRRFEIDPVDLFVAIKAERAGGPQLAGCYHSHPNGLAEPSATDRACAAGDGKAWIIVAGDRLTAWRSSPDGFQAVELVIDPLPPESVSATRPS
jgi:proteasome lid subunit RPN8/RPN11